MIEIDLSKQQEYNKSHFTANLDQAGQTTTYFIFEEAKETILDFLQITMKVLLMFSTVLFCSSIISK